MKKFVLSRGKQMTFLYNPVGIFYLPFFYREHFSDINRYLFYRGLSMMSQRGL
jgi:hypothetical protein